MILKFCIIIESNSQKTFSSIVLYTNMAAVTSRENRQLNEGREMESLISFSKELKFSSIFNSRFDQSDEFL